MFAKKIKIDMKKFRPSGVNELKKQVAVSENKTIAAGKKLSNFKVPPSESVKHRYGPEDAPPSLSRDGKISSVQKRVPLAFCPNCNADAPMKWKPPEKRGKNVESWFTCTICGYDRLEIKRLNAKGK